MNAGKHGQYDGMNIFIQINHIKNILVDQQEHKCN